MEPKRRGLVMLIIGLVMMIVLAPIAFFGSLGIGAVQMVNKVSDAPVVQSGTSRHFNADETVTLLPRTGATGGGNGVSTSSNQPTPIACVVTDPSGSSVTADHPGNDLTVTKDGVQYTSGTRFTAKEAGDYRISCGGNPALLLDEGVRSSLLQNFGVTVIIGLIAGALLGITGLILTIVGAVKLSRSGKERSAWRNQQQMAMYNQQQQGGYNQNPYGGYNNQNYNNQNYNNGNNQDPYRRN